MTAFEAAARDAGVPMTIMRDAGGEAAERYEARLVLVRPDAFVAWAGDTGGGKAASILATVRGAT